MKDHKIKKSLLSRRRERVIKQLKNGRKKQNLPLKDRKNAKGRSLSHQVKRVRNVMVTAKNMVLKSLSLPITKLTTNQKQTVTLNAT